MSNQDSLFDGGTGRERKREGQERVSRNAQEFLKWVRGEAKRISHEKGSVSINDLRPLADKLGIVPHHLNAWGPVFNEDGWVPIGSVYARRPVSNGRVVRIWRWTR